VKILSHQAAAGHLFVDLQARQTTFESLLVVIGHDLIHMNFQKSSHLTYLYCALA